MTPNNITKLGLAVLLTSFSLAGQAGMLTLSGTIYDKLASEPDFQDGISGLREGLVSSNLNGLGVPDYVGVGGNTAASGIIQSAASFANWWTDTAGSRAIDIDLAETAPGVFSYTNSAFFPINGELGGNEGLSNNYHFAMHLEGKTSFTSADIFNFTGDDDLWIYIDNKLVMDLGGVHAALSKTITGQDLLDLGLMEGTEYDLDIFFAERHTTQSNFNITTSFRVASVPEPGSLALVALGLVGLGLRRRYKAKA